MMSRTTLSFDQVLKPFTRRAVGAVVNDIHSKLNPTVVREIVTPRSSGELPAIVRHARQEGLQVAIAGGKHAMGGQQFRSNGLLIDTRAMTGVRHFDPVRGLIEVEAGMQWPTLFAALGAIQHCGSNWGIAQKQTGADTLSIGGAVAANIHGRGLAMAPFVSDIEALTLVDASGELLRCSRSENAELFRLAVGGYGLFGVIATVTIRLVPRRKLERIVEIADTSQLIAAFDARLAAGDLYGDFQFAIDERSDDFLHAGVLSTYRPVEDDATMAPERHALTDADWDELLHLAHTDKSEAFRRYCAHYRLTSGQLYWSDTHQLTTYREDYHRVLDARCGARHPGSEMITELYVPRHELSGFLDEGRAMLRDAGADVIYGTIRLIEPDTETALRWARGRQACVIFNLHIDHTRDALARASDTFRALIDLAAARGGSFYLTYHRWARRDQLERCYPELESWMMRKREVDPAGVFASDWWEWLGRRLG